MSIENQGILTVRPKIITRVMSSLPVPKVEDMMKESKTLNAESDHCYATINLVEREISKLATNDGEMLKMLRKSGKTDIKFSGQVVIEGSTEDVENFKVEINAFLARKCNKDVTVKIEIKEEHSRISRIKNKPKQLFKIKKVNLEVSGLEATIIIGKEGEGIKSIQQKTGTKMKMLGKKGDVKQKIEITGLEKQIDIAKNMINEKKGLVTLVGQMKNDEVGFLLREGGKGVSVIEKETNTYIVFGGKKGDRKRAVHVEGSEEDKIKAWSMILKQLCLRT